MTPNLSFFDRFIRLLLGAFAVFAALLLFDHPVSRIIAAAFGILAIGECFVGYCYLHGRLGLRSARERLSQETLFLLGLAGAQAILAYEWWSAGWEKISSPDFVANLEKTLGFFASKNPFPWYKNFLEGFAMRNATSLAYLVEWSQIAIGVVLFLGAMRLLYGRSKVLKRLALVGSGLALFGGLLMNADFYLAAAWTSPATRGSNLVMFWTQAMLLYVWLYLLVKKEVPRS
ncbi:DUF2892 domain-containing protein [Candidatus Uhrbacteria bacterium]|nr:DUF2892 domain-containing protein [Candidatus Uhrbacteria bacterium]